VAGIADLLATKLKIIGDRGELRDYFDLKTIEERTAYRVEQGIGLYVAATGRTRRSPASPTSCAGWAPSATSSTTPASPCRGPRSSGTGAAASLRSSRRSRSRAPKQGADA